MEDRRLAYPTGKGAWPPIDQEEVPMIRKASVIVLVALFFTACQTTDPNDPNAKAKRGAGAGAAVGAVVGAIIGNQTGDPRTGAVIGAAVGAAVGASVGHDLDKQQRELQQIPGVEVTRPSENQIDVRLTGDILFDFGSSELRPDARVTLRDLAENFRHYQNEQYDVEGHTDGVGPDESNVRLSQRRADAVRGYMIDEGVLASQIVAYGYGATRPKASNDTPEGRQINRRVEIHIRGK
jgi:outer membrane protein OmpA-like peptidoglycan-associated protein